MSSTSMLRSLLRFLVLALAALLLVWTAGCGGGGGDPEPPPPAATEVAAGQRAQSAVGSAGGTVLLASTEGARFTLSVPAGAVPEGTVLALETAAPAAGRRLHLRLSPAGLVPASPLVLTVSLPASMALPTGAALVYDRAPVPFARLADGSLQLRLASLAGGTAGSAGAGRAHALAARPLADSAAAPPCTGVPALDTTPEGGLTDTAPIEADVYGSCMLGAVNALAVSGEFAEAVRLASAIGAYVQSIGAANTDGLSTLLLNQARTLACTAYGQALDTAASTTITDFGTLPRVVRPLLFWQATIEKLGTTCPGIAPTRYVEVIEELTTDAMVFFSLKRGAVVDTFSVEYTEAVATVRSAPATVAEVRSLQASAPVQAVAEAQLQQRAQPAVVDAVLQAPWLRCRDSGNFDKLIELMEQADKPAAVKTAAQYCGTQLQAQAKNAAGAVTATLAPSLGGISAGNQRLSGSLDVARDGTLVLSGPIRALQCPAGSTGGTESLQLKLGSTVLQTLSAAPYLASDLVIDIAQALEVAGINTSSFTGATLTLGRSGSPCGGFWGDNPEPLLTLTLTSGTCVPAAGQSFCVTPIDMPGTAEVGYFGLIGLNDRGAVLFLKGDTQACTTSEGAPSEPCGGIWRKSGSQWLPDRFLPQGMSNDGTVAGSLYAGTRTIDPAVVLPGSSTAQRLATSIAQSNGDPPSAIGYRLDTISPEGRVTYSQVRGGYGYSGTDYGFCNTPSGSSIPYCWKEIFYETSGPAYGAGTQIHQSQLPGGEGRTELFFDNDAQGRGGALGLFSGSSQFASRNFSRGEAEVVLLMMDRSGASLVYERTTARRALRDSSVSLRTGFEPVLLGLQGHGLACNFSGETWQAQVFNTGGTVGDPLDAFFDVRIGDAVAQVSLPCNTSIRDVRLVDSRGRILAYASSEARPRLRGVILTPAGVALP